MDSNKKKERVKVHFPGALDSHFSQVLEIREKMEPIDTFRVMDTDGKVLDKSLEPEVCLSWLFVDEGRICFSFSLFNCNEQELVFFSPSEEERCSRRERVIKVLAVGQSWEIYDDFFFYFGCLLLCLVLWGRTRGGQTTKISRLSQLIIILWPRMKEMEGEPILCGHSSNWVSPSWTLLCPLPLLSSQQSTSYQLLTYRCHIPSK